MSPGIAGCSLGDKISLPIENHQSKGKIPLGKVESWNRKRRGVHYDFLYSLHIQTPETKRKTTKLNWERWRREETLCVGGGRAGRRKGREKLISWAWSFCLKILHKQVSRVFCPCEITCRWARAGFSLAIGPLSLLLPSSEGPTSITDMLWAEKAAFPLSALFGRGVEESRTVIGSISHYHFHGQRGRAQGCQPHPHSRVSTLSVCQGCQPHCYFIRWRSHFPLKPTA